MTALSRLVFRTARYGGIATLARAVRPGAVVLCYHNVVKGAVSGVDPGLHIDVETFRAQMTWLARHFAVVSLDELRERARRGQALRGLASLTFDDAYQGALTHGLGVLRELGLPVTVFVPTAAPDSGQPFWWDCPAAVGAVTDRERRDQLLETLGGDAAAILAGSRDARALPPQCLPSSWTQLRGVRSADCEIAAHSVSHRTLPRLSDDALAAEFSESARAIQEEIGAPPRWFAYPYGRWDARVAAAARAAGYVGAWTLEGNDVGIDVDWCAAPRINVPAGIGFDAFVGWISGFSHWRALRSRA